MTWYLLDGRHVVRRLPRRRWPQEPAIHATSHVHHEKELNGFLFLCMWFCSYSYGEPLDTNDHQSYSPVNPWFKIKQIATEFFRLP